ncbi:hypothetical protein BGW38_001617 [Lunasporangiospora selenospora]|uniref:Peptidase M20 dimerisation domain-containing protein n=1 Tax=Lunasporangiospora selenospora TaxID=979761 RepID=A0A9P6FUD5_9FUNG|nr:hypothetical protein BGW38_001617 [Lunasporangiospora selenospora]
MPLDPEKRDSLPSVSTSTGAGAAGCLDVFRNLFVNDKIKTAKHQQPSNEKPLDSTLPPAYESHAEYPEMSQVPTTAAASAQAQADLVEAWTKNEFAKAVHEAIEAVSTELRQISLQLHSNPELAYEEYKAHALLTDYLEKKGFAVQRSAYGLETAFVARAGNSDKVTIGICSEYDALPGIGHACGHNLIAISGVATAIGLQVAIQKFNLEAEVKLFGTPAEETTGGKIVMLNNGAFEGVDVCMMLHGANADVIYPAFLALDTVDVEYFGKASHASASPWEGINALDAAVLAYTNIGLMRQQMHPSQRVHGIIKDGGQAVNIIPEYTKSTYTVRAPKWDEVVLLKQKIERVLKGAATSTGCTVKLTWGVPYKDILTNEHLVKRFEHHMNAQGLKYASKTEQLSKLSGSTDMGNMSYALPGIHPMFNILNLDGSDYPMGLHTKDFAHAAAQPKGHTATLRAAKSLAMTGVDCILDKNLLKQVKHEFAKSTQQ